MIRPATALLLAFCCSPSLSADEGPPPEPPVKATVFAMPHPDVSEETVVGALRALETGLKRNPRLEVHDLDTRLADFAQEVPQEQVEAARTALKDGQKALLELNIPQAIQRLQEASSGLAKVLPYIKKQELADAMAALAVAFYENGETAKGREQFISLLTWRTDFIFDPQKLSPKYIGLFEEAQKVVEQAKRGILEIGSDPSGAQAYVDGKYVGVTPCQQEGLPVGEHFVTYKKEGFKKKVAAAKVSGKKVLKVTVTLEGNEKYLVVQQAIEKIAPTLGADVVAPEMDDLKQVLFIEHGIFVKASPKGDGRVEIDTFLYDLRTRRRLSRVTKTVAVSQAEAQLSSLASSLYLNVNYSPDLVAPKDKPPPPKLVRTPIYKTWWFWTGSAVIAGIIVATTLAVVETRPIPCPMGSACFQVIQ